MFRHLLVPTDGSDLAQAAADRAVAFAKALNAKITFFYAQPEFPLPVYGEGALIDPTTPEQFRKAAADEATAILNAAKERARAAGVDADTDTVVSDAAAEAIIAAAERHACDLIFIASHGRTGIARLLLGSVTHKVLAHSKLPVLVYR